jgi:3-oxoacyl-[acyl-carrier protein] reductase
MPEPFLPSTSSFSGRPGVAIVTGGSGAVGAAVCSALAEVGADLALTYRGNEAAARAVADRVEALGRRAHVGRVALENPDEVRAFVEQVASDLGGIHTVVAAAGPLVPQRFVGRVSTDELRAQVEQDVIGFHALVTAALPALRETRGSVVAVTTVANRRFVLRDFLSSAPKAGIEAIVQAVAAEEGRFGVRANAVGVGILGEGMSTALIERGDVRASDMEHALQRIPLARLGVADDIARACRFLASDDAAYITGQWIDVDGGYSI